MGLAPKSRPGAPRRTFGALPHSPSVRRPLPGGPPSSALGPTDDYVAGVRFAIDEIEKECGELLQAKGVDWREDTAPLLAEAQAVRDAGGHWVLLTHRIVEFDPADLDEKVDTLIRTAGELWRSSLERTCPYDPEDRGWKR